MSVQAVPSSNTIFVQASNWIRFLRGYGPVLRNENMYDEFIRRSAKRLGVAPLDFEHPARASVIGSLQAAGPTSVILTGTAGDGKTYLCRQVWEAVGGDPAAWNSKDPQLTTVISQPGKDSGAPKRTLHVVRDLSAWAPQRGSSWAADRQALLQRFSASLFAEGEPSELFLIAANDGQLLESWHRLENTPAAIRAREVLETLLVEDAQTTPGVALQFFNLSRRSSATLFERALNAFLAHDGWKACRELNSGPQEFFGPACPIRHNLELLSQPLVRERLKSLMSLCDYNRTHIPIRQILLLLANAVLGHSNAADGLMTAEDVPKILEAGSTGRASLYENVFGGNLSTTRRENRLVFDALDRFGIGHETTNRIDNILIFGEADESLQEYFEKFVGSDSFYGSDHEFLAAQRAYVEGADEDEDRSADFLRQLVGKRRGFFFKIADSDEADLQLWKLTVFSFAGEYLARVVAKLANGEHVDRPILSRLTRGLNRVFTGLLLADDRELLLATSLTTSEGRISRLLEDRVSVEPRRGDRVELVLRSERSAVPLLEVSIDGADPCALPLYLTRYEFLCRVAEGALPSSFSKECYEDILAFKSQLLATLSRSRVPGVGNSRDLSFQLIEIDEGGKSAVTDLEVLGA